MRYSLSMLILLVLSLPTLAWGSIGPVRDFGRLTKIDRAGTDRDVTYTYDSTADGNKGVGRRTGMVDASGTTAWYYDEYGEVVKEVKDASVTLYTYDVNGNLLTVSNTDGRVDTYTYDAMDRVTKKTSVKSGTTKVLADNVLYAPFGGIASFTYGAGLTEKREYDPEGRLTYLKSGPFLKRNYGYDANGNIAAITDLVNAAKSQAFGYDTLNRLISATGAYGTLAYEYDAVGNRTKKTENGVITNYTYLPGTNHLAPPYEYDASGNMTSDGTNDYVYEDTGGLPPTGAGGGFEPNVYPYVGGNPLNYVDPEGLWGIGVTGSETTDLGIYAIGAGQNGTAGVGFFGSGLSNFNAGGLASWGGFAGGPIKGGYGYAYPSGPDCSRKNTAIGAFGGAGLGVYITNATNVSQLAGPFRTYSFNAGWGIRLLSLQLAVSKSGTWMFTYGGPLGPWPTGGGYGASFSIYNTNTKVKK